MIEYADDRPWPGSSGWSDAASRSALHAIAGAVEHLTGYEVACINVVHGGLLRAVAVAGTPVQRAILMDSQMPVSAMEEEFAAGVVLGRFVFVAAGQLDRTHDYGAVFDVDTLDPAQGDAYDVEDLLTAPIRDDEGRLIAMLSVDVPVNRRRADAAVVERLDRYADLVEAAVRMALDHDEQHERIRMARAARRVVAAASRELSMKVIFEESAQALISGFAARGVWFQTFDLAAETFAAVHLPSGMVHAVPPDMLPLAERVARREWARQRVVVLSSERCAETETETQAETEAKTQAKTQAETQVKTTRATGTGPTAEARDGDRLQDQEGYERDVTGLLAYLDGIDVGSVLLVPVGVGAECLGCLALSRPRAGRGWTAVETEAARDIGMDLGRAILNARAYAREQQAVVELQALNSYKSQLVATLSHELKTPLASILGNLELLEDDGLSTEDGRRGLSALSRGAARLVRVVDDLMLLARVGDPTYELVTRPVDLADVVIDVLDLMGPAAVQGGVHMQLVADPDPVCTLGDSAELDRMVTNIVSNALKYTPPGGRMELRVEQLDGAAVLTCEDNGIGISEADQARLFLEFFRSSDPAAQAQAGTGLGLTIVERIVRRHHGRIEVSSAVGTGSTFTVTLPLAPPERVAPELEHDQCSAEAGASVHG